MRIVRPVAVSCDDPAADAFPLASEGNGNSPGRQDLGALDADDLGFDASQVREPAPFFDGFTRQLTPGIPDTTRHVEPRNTNTMHNAIFNLRSFHDGRADMFFNGVNPLGFRDPGAMVTVYDPSRTVALRRRPERMNVPFSSLASQAVGPIESVMEMVGHLPPAAGRPNHNLGRKMVEATPLFNQLVSCTDPLLGSLVAADANCGSGGTGSAYIPTNVTYRSLIEPIFAERFWGNGSGAGDVCLEDDSDVTRRHSRPKPI